MLNHREIADRSGVTLGELNELLNGRVSGIANRLGVTPGDVETILRGGASLAMTRRLGLNTPAAGIDLATSAGRDGAIGVVLGLLLSA